MWVGFLYTEVVILTFFMSMRISRNGSFPWLSFSIVNVMDGLCVFRCFKNYYMLKMKLNLRKCLED